MSRKVALLIGVSEYGEDIPSLSAPLNDVAAMKRVLENPEMGGFDEITIRINPDPTAMRLAVQQVFASRRKDDLVLLFFSGHGITDDNNKLYLATKGTSKDFYKATSVPASFIQDVSLESYAKRQAIILDCCYSGAFAEGWQTKNVGLDFKQELGGEGRVVLTSSTATQTSFQQEGEELSLYTKYFVEGIETGAADRDEDGKIHAHELHDYAKTKVQEEKPKQKPGIILDKEGFNILLSQAPVNDPELDFRKLVEQYASQGEISSYRRETLKIKQEEYNLTNEKADEIIHSVLEPFRLHSVNLEKYRQNYRKQVEDRYPLDRTLAQDMKDWGQQVLGLQDEELDQIEQDINTEKEAQQQHQQEIQQKKKEEYSHKLKQYQQEFLQAVEREYPLSNNACDRIHIRQQSLGLRDEDIKPIEQAILAVNKYQEKEQERQREQEEYKNKLQQSKINTPLLSRKTSILFGGGIAAALALAITFSVLPKSPQTQQNGYIQPNSDVQESPANSQLSAKDFLKRGLDKQNKEDYQGAIEDFTKAIELQPDYFQAYYERGLVHSDQLDERAAIEDFTQAIELQPDYFPAYYNRGIVHRNQGDNKAAIEDFNQAIELQPDYFPAYYNRGIAYRNRGDNQRAIEDFTQAIELQPDYAIAYFNRGFVRSKQGDNQGAIEDYQKALNLYQKQGNTKLSQIALQKIKELKP